MRGQIDPVQLLVSSGGPVMLAPPSVTSTPPAGVPVTVPLVINSVTARESFAAEHGL